MMAWPFRDLEPASFGLVAADPAWEWKARTDDGLARSPQRHYDTMPLDEICALPAGDLAWRDSVLLLWCSSPFLMHGLSVLSAWGFRYGGFAAWGKQTVDGRKFKTGTGYVVGSTAELILIGLRGSPKLPGNSASNLICADRVPGAGDLLCAPRREHSRKPDGFHEWAERHFHGPFVELFARRSHLPHWRFWGNEATKFNGEAE